VLSVKDRGAGLTKEELAQLGERFFRGHRLAGTTSGSGLGLWIAKAFVGANGGRLQANSTGADQGTTVSLFLPYNADVNQPEAAPDD
jgi:two-component system sensor histidine kinase KdpD